MLILINQYEKLIIIIDLIRNPYIILSEMHSKKEYGHA